jgi:hypothetical protein
MEQTSQVTKTANYGVGNDLNLPPVQSGINVEVVLPNLEVNPVISAGGYGVYNDDQIINPEQNFYNKVNKITKGEQVNLKINFSDLNNVNNGVSENIGYGMNNTGYGASGSIGTSDNFGVSESAGYGFNANVEINSSPSYNVNPNVDYGASASYGVNSDLNVNTNIGAGANSASYGVYVNNLDANVNIGQSSNYGATSNLYSANTDNFTGNQNQGYGVNINKDSNANQFDNIKFQGQINLNSNI